MAISEKRILSKAKSRVNLKARTTPRRRPRRSTKEVIDRILDAACVEFEQHGYAGAKTAAIARKAGVAEPLIFNHFGSKAKLFHDSIFKPLEQHILDFCATHLVDPDNPDSFRDYTREYILKLIQFIERHSRMLTSLAAAQMYRSDQVQGLSQVESLNSYFSQATALANKNHPGKIKIDFKLLGRVSFATILACVIFKDWLFPDGLASEREITAAIIGFILEGLSANDQAKSSAPRQVRPQSAAGALRTTRS